MHCDLPDDIAWPTLLTARSLLAAADRELAWTRRDGPWSCAYADETSFEDANEIVLLPTDAGTTGQRPAPPGRFTVVQAPPRGPVRCEHPGNRPVDPAMQAMLRLYAPVLRGACRARHTGGVFVAAHLTQTLDGRIACSSGRPQWIGNDADRRHAHRMRALLDGVMVGAATAIADDPQLDVRSVSGPDPRRIVLSGGGRVLHLERPLRVFQGAGCDVVVAADRTFTSRDGARLVPVAAAATSLAPAAILEALAARGLRSIYLEGGARTLSSFLQARAIDLLQVHVAPVVLGSGLPGFQLPPLDSLQDAYSFAMQHCTLGSDVLFTCWPQPGRSPR